jgi:hypothetical protein
LPELFQLRHWADGFYYLLADEELLRDFFVAVRLGNKLDNFLFA